ncbi:MAG: RsmE family RNA methyltransferase [Ignavibacteria bacterium]
MEYYYTDKENIAEKVLRITGEEAHHLKNVLRKNKGNEIWITNGEKFLYKTQIISAGKEEITCEILDTFYNVNEPSKKIHLYLSLLKNPSRFEFALEKSVEIGVNEITPLITEHVINKETEKTERWQSITLSAMKQSQRCYLPKINKPVNFNEAIKIQGEICKIIAHEKTDKEYKFISETGNNISLFIGPEGGFTYNEIDEAKTNDFKILNLGKRKLRSETAALVGLSKLL